MRYQNLLYSRSFPREKDYRWILTPSFFSRADSNKLQELMWLNELRNYLPMGLTSPFSFCLFFLSESYVLTRLWQTEHADEFRRPIDCVDGIAVPLSDAWLLRLSLASILTDHLDILNSWKTLDFQESAFLTNSIPKECKFDINSLNVNSSVNSKPSSIAFYDEQFPFNQDGFEKLINYLRPAPNVNKLELLQIAFGVTNISKYSGFEIITTINKFDLNIVEDTPAIRSGQETPEEPTLLSPPMSSNFQNPLSSDLPSSEDFNKRVEELRAKSNTRKEVQPAESGKPSLWNMLSKNRKRRPFVICFKDKNNRPVRNTEVYLKWSNGLDNLLWTDNNGRIELEQDNTLEEVKVHDKTAKGKWRLGENNPLIFNFI